MANGITGTSKRPGVLEGHIKGAAYRAYRAVRTNLERSFFLEKSIRALAEVKNIALDSSRRDRSSLDHLFANQPDPYGFHRKSEQLRFSRAEQMINLVAAGTRLRRVFELGCAEGIFTERLAKHSASLLAVDISGIALERARYRCPGNHISFQRCDIRDGIPGTDYDCVVAIGVLEYLHGRTAFHHARETLVNAVLNNGYLLIGSTLQEQFEATWVARRFLLGGEINRFFTEDPRLELLESKVDQFGHPFMHSLFRRTCNAREQLSALYF